MKKSLLIFGLILLLVLVYTTVRFSHSFSKPTTQQKGVVQMKTQPTVMASNSVYQVMPSAKLGPIFTDTNGKTLYTYKLDSEGVSKCMAGCLKAWPAYQASSNVSLPQNISVLRRSDGLLQYAWKGMPLYFYSNDKQPGDVNGEGIGKVWSVIHQ